MQQPHAVLTGDLIGSRAAGPDTTDATFDRLAYAADHLSRHFGPHDGFYRFRGDGWQMPLFRPGYSLYACIYITALLRADRRAIPTRIAVGIGTIESVPGTAIEAAFGEAFTESGLCLDVMPRGKRLGIAGSRFVQPWHQAIFDLVEWQSGRWSPEQAEAIALSVTSDSHHERLAEALGITRQAMQARLKSAGRGAFDQALKAFQSHRFVIQYQA